MQSNCLDTFPEPPRSGRRWSGTAVVVLSAVLAALTTVGAFGHRKAATAPPPPAAAPSSAAGLPRVVAASGEMGPLKEVKISPEVSGEIIELPVKEGQRVRKGELLVRIKSDVYQANRDHAEGGCKSAQANRDIALARLAAAGADLRRSQDLYESKLVTDAEFEQVKAAYAVAQAQVSAAEGQLETARACLARAQYDLNKTVILSPMTGTVAKLNSQVGERVVGTATMAGTEMMILADLKDMEARVEVGEREIGLIGCGQKAQLELSAFPGHSYTGTVLEIATSAARYGVTSEAGERKGPKFQVRIRLHDQRSFRPGMSVTAKIEALEATPGSTPSPGGGAKAAVQPYAGQGSWRNEA